MDNVIELSDYRSESEVYDFAKEFSSKNAKLMRLDLTEQEVFYAAVHYYQRLELDELGGPIWSDYVDAYCGLPTTITHTSELKAFEYQIVPLSIVRDAAFLSNKVIYFHLLYEDGDLLEGFAENEGKLHLFSTHEFTKHEKQMLESIVDTKNALDEEGKPHWKELRDNPEEHEFRRRRVVGQATETRLQGDGTQKFTLRCFQMFLFGLWKANEPHMFAAGITDAKMLGMYENLRDQDHDVWLSFYNRFRKLFYAESPEHFMKESEILHEDFNELIYDELNRTDEFEDELLSSLIAFMLLENLVLEER